MAYIKLYPYRLSYFTLDAVTDEESGYEMEYMLDTRRVTYWQSDDATGNKYVEFDFGSTGYMTDALCLYYDDGSGTPGIGVWGDNNSDYSTETELYGQTPTTQNGWGLRVIDMTTASNLYRYHRVRFSALSSAIKVSQLFLSPEFEVSVNINYGDDRGVDYSGVNFNESRSGVRSADLRSPARPYQMFAWDLLDETNKEKIESVMEITGGGQYPLFMIDPDGVTRFGRIMNKKLGAIRTHDATYGIPALIWQDELGDPE